MISHINDFNQNKINNQGKIFIILGEQNMYQKDLEELVVNPKHIYDFTQVIDTTYFGKSHHSKLIQIADLIAGIIRNYLSAYSSNKPNTHFMNRIEKIYGLIQQNTIYKECFQGGLKTLFDQIEIKNP